jgi:hypothetical protein
MDNQSLVNPLIEGFFLRCGLTLQDQLDCHEFVRRLHPGKSISLSVCQGYCSMTVFVGEDTVMQFRPRAHRLNLQVTRAARGIYGQMAPETMYLGIVPGSGLLVYSMKRMEGISYRDFISCDLSLPLAQSTPHRATLCKDFALFLARSWYSRNAECLPVGQIGGSIRHRLASLCRDLPSRFQPTAQGLLERLPQIESLPWVLTHGDIVQSNIIVDPASGTLAGLVDWAEAEILPFGVCLYGLEEILGKMTVSGFRYQPDAGELRDLFWVELANLIPALRQADTRPGRFVVAWHCV